MLNKILPAGLLAVAVVTAFPDRASAAANVSVGVNIGIFHDRLAPYGEWISVNRYGTCWRPRHVVRTWRPYTVGHWAYTDYGWTWVSDEDWGWATYHYGRWVYDPYYGWVWVPGTRWAPAYVTWRYGDDWVGWAPLPPGIEPGVFVNVNIAPSAYSFVQTRDFLDRRLGGRFAPESRNAFLFGATRNVTRYNVEGGRIINRGVDVRQIERVSGRPVEHLRVRDTAEATRAGVGNHELSVYRPSADRTGQLSRSGVESPRADRRWSQAEQRQPQIARQQRQVERPQRQFERRQPQFERQTPIERQQARPQAQPRAERQQRVQQQPRVERQMRVQQQPRVERQPRFERRAPSDQQRQPSGRQERATTGRAPSNSPRSGGGQHGGGRPHGGGGPHGDQGGGHRGGGKHEKG